MGIQVLPSVLPTLIPMPCTLPFSSSSRCAVLGPGGQSDINLAIIDSGGTWRTYLHENRNVSRTSAAEIRYF